MVYETGNRTVDEAVQRVLDGERLDRTDGLALLAQPVGELAAGADMLAVISAVFATADICAAAQAFSPLFDLAEETPDECRT